jgi:hypothetical protein
MTSAKNVSATFSINTFAINFVSGGNGTLTGTASQTVIYGGSATAVTAVPLPSYHFVNWTGTGSFVTTATNPLTVTNVTAAQTITANFASKLTPTITWANPAAITFGTALGAAQLNATASVPGTFVYNPAAGVVLNAGANQTLSVTFTPTDTTNYSTATASVQVTVNKATATVTLGSLNQIYDGTQQPATAATNPVGLTVTFTYNGSGTAPTNVGSYTVVGTINDTNYQGSASGTLVIAKAAATVTLGSLNQIYDGSPKPATATTNPAGLTVTFTYNGSGTAPTNAGSYTVVGTINDTTYQGSASGTLVIAKAAATVTLGNLNQIYDGSPKPATATTNPAGLTVTFTYNGSGTAPTNAGSYAVVGTINDTNYQGSASGTLVIAKAVATVTLHSLGQTYDGTQQPATATTNPAGLTVTFTYDGSGTAPTNAGSYAVVGTINDTNYQGSASGTLVIAKATPTITWASPSDITYPTPLDSTQLNATASVPGTFVYNPAAGTVLNAGKNQTLSVTFTPTDTTNYNTATASVRINVN